MERVIKFRAKRMDSNEWLFGSLFVDKNDQCYIKEPDGKLYFIEDKDTIGQFTSLKDKNGKDIYEGDIISFVDGQKRVKGELVDNVHFYNVEYSKGAFSGVLGLAESMDAVEVIGNKYDNPELLKQ